MLSLYECIVIENKCLFAFISLSQIAQSLVPFLMCVAKTVNLC